MQVVYRQGGAFPETGSEDRLLPRNGLDVQAGYIRGSSTGAKTRLYVPIPMPASGGLLPLHMFVYGPEGDQYSHPVQVRAHSFA